MSYLLDTNAVSEIRKGARGDPQVTEWLATVDAEELYLSVITLGELRRGIDAVERRDRPTALALNRWYRRLVTVYEHRILVIDLRVVEEWGRITANVSLPVADALIAATARVHGLTVVTRDVKDMERIGVSCLNPFAAR